MQYKTIALALIEEQPELHEQLRSSRTLLAAMDAYAVLLKVSHEAWKDRLSETNPVIHPSQISSEAMELAVQELRDRLPSESPKEEAEPMDLGAAMEFLRRHTPPA